MITCGNDVLCYSLRHGLVVDYLTEVNLGSRCPWPRQGAGDWASAMRERERSVDIDQSDVYLASRIQTRYHKMTGIAAKFSLRSTLAGTIHDSASLETCSGSSGTKLPSSLPT